MLNKILVPLDGSALAEKALDLGVLLARAAKAELVLLRVAEPVQVLAPPATRFDAYHLEVDTVKARDTAKRYLVETAHNVRAKYPELQVKYKLFDGHPAERIVDAGVTFGFDLILMSSHGYSGLRRWIMGSVAAEVLKTAETPVWVVREGDTPERIMLALDGSPTAEAILPITAAVTEALGAELLLATVIPENAPELHREDIENYLKMLTHRLEPYNLRLNHVVLAGDPVEKLTDLVENREIDLVAMATHGRTGLKRLAYGSVTERMLQRVPDKAVLIMRPWQTLRKIEALSAEIEALGNF